MSTGLPKTRWNGKDAIASYGGKVSYPSLIYDGKKSEDEIISLVSQPLKTIWEGNNTVNKLYFADNLLVLRKLMEDDNVRGKVRLVYIDPPFATKSIFQSRALTDAYTDLLEGSNYIEFMRERLILIRELLAIDGSIYVHLDHNMAFYMKVIMDEVFGVSNFRNWITRKKSNPKNYTRKTFGNVSDFILFYTKSDEYVWNRSIDPWTKEHADKEYTYIEEGTGRRFKKVPIHAPGTRNGETGKAWKGKLPPPGKHWQYTPKTLDEMDERGEIFWSQNGNPRRKVYLDESKGIPVQDIWLNFKDAHNQNIKVTGYPTEKNPDLLKRIIEASSKEGDIVLDCFSGSGTTLEMAEFLGRRWIGVDSSPEAISTTLKRFIIGVEPMGDYVEKKGNNNSISVSSPKLFQIHNFVFFTTEEKVVEAEEIARKWLF